MSKVQVRDEYGSCWKDFHSNISLLTSNLSPNLLHSPHEHISLKMFFFILDSYSSHFTNYTHFRSNYTHFRSHSTHLDLI